MKRHAGRDERGAAAVEFALVAPLLFSIIMGIVEFGVAINFKSQLNNVTTIAARDYGVNRNKTQAETIIDSVATASGTSAKDIKYAIDGVVGQECNDANSGKVITLAVTVKRTTITKILGETPISYKAQAVTRCN